MLIIIKSRLGEGSQAAEGLRLAAAMLGMDMLPTIIFLDRGVDLLLPGGVEGDLLDYLKAISSLAGVKALKESLGPQGEKALNQELEVEVIDMERLIDLILECESVIAL
ncbi:MAG: DsrE family protein [Candidatus Bathyarchaeia archaeon]